MVGNNTNNLILEGLNIMAGPNPLIMLIIYTIFILYFIYFFVNFK